MEETRTLTPSDIPGLLELCSAAGWNQTEADWLRVMALEPEGCIGVACDGRIVATATAVCYGRDLAWIGMVLTHADHRGRGLGTRTTARAVEHARSRGVRAIKLDATDMGRPVYLRLGFVDECAVERWTRGPESPPLTRARRGPRCEPYRPDPALDRAAFGADRGAVLASLARGPSLSVPGQGFAMARRGARALQLGPCVARSAQAARALLVGLLEREPATNVYWDLLPGNPHAAALAAEIGFTPARKLVRMALRQGGSAPSLEHDDSLVYAGAGFEYG
jgi:GNAT superfamily N-acetyltransferase